MTAKHPSGARRRQRLSSRVVVAGFQVSTGGRFWVSTEVLDGPRVLRDLMTLVQSSDAQGVLVHIDNLENLSEAGALNAGTIMRDLRDPLFMHNGLHYVVVGTPDAIQAAITAHAQVRTTFSIRTLEPMPAADVHRLLDARYAWLQKDPAMPVIPPVDPAAADEIYELYRGDLRGLLQALDDGVTPNIGLGPRNKPSRADSGIGLSAIIRPLQFDDIAPTLRQEYQEQLTALPEEHHVRRLLKWGETRSATPQTQQKLTALWKVRQATVSETLSYLIKQGLVVAMPRQGKAPIEYHLSGRSRLIFS